MVLNHPQIWELPTVQRDARQSNGSRTDFSTYSTWGQCCLVIAADFFCEDHPREKLKMIADSLKKNTISICKHHSALHLLLSYWRWRTKQTDTKSFSICFFQGSIASTVGSLPGGSSDQQARSPRASHRRRFLRPKMLFEFDFDFS